jgi:phosphinothricin acetyltransferase
MIRPVNENDSAAILDIYNYYIENTVITFEEKALSLPEMKERIKKISGKYPYIVREDDGEVTGYAYANTWRERAAYRYSAEISIYLKNGCQGKGRGMELLEKLLEEIRKTSLHVLVSGIALPNERSVRLFEKFGFRKIGHHHEIGFKEDRWVDVGYWELVLN